MLITFKNLQQQTFQIEISPFDTVKELKRKIEEEKGAEYPADNQRLIYAGKILTDDDKLEAYNIDEKKFIVVMVTKPKQAEPAPPAPAPPAVAPPAPAPPVVVPPPAPQPESADAEESGDAAAEHERLVRSIMELGYGRARVEQALRASFDNQERAVEYLINGIPEDLLMEQLEGEGDPEGDAPAGSEEDPLAFLRNQPQFQQMRAVIQQDPSLLNTILQQIGQTNPALLQVISQHQAAFVRMLNETSGGSGSGGGTTAAAQPASVPATAAAAAAANPQSALQFSPEDMVAIGRLRALGFPEHMVIQAYFACEKNENLAANFLLSQNFDD